MIFISSYLLACVISHKKCILVFIYLFLIMFAQTVLTFEILSLFNAINKFGVIAFNILFFVIIFVIWIKNDKPVWSLNYDDFKNKVNNSFKLDKSLFLLYITFCIFIIISLILCILMPITSADANIYHVARSLFWIEQGSLSHFDIADVRNLCLPINSEILYSWILLFLKKDIFLSFFSFAGYLLSIVSIYNILGFIGCCTRKRLWVIFILSSFASVIVQASGTETDIIIAGLVTSSIYLFWYGIKNNRLLPVFMSSLAYALAIGTKTTSLIMLPGVCIFLLLLCIYYKKYKPIFWFAAFGVLNFLIFSSYNYILNYIQFSHFMSSESFMLVNKNYYGIKAIPANFIKYIFMFFDFTGLKCEQNIVMPMLNFRNSFLTVLHLSSIKDGLYTSYTSGLIEPRMGTGILGFVAFLPCLIFALIAPFFNCQLKKRWLIFGFAFMFILNLISISYFLNYMSYSARFIMSFVVISSPVLIYSYFKKWNLLKFLIVFSAMFYFIIIPTHIWARPFIDITSLLFKGYSLADVRKNAICDSWFQQYMNPTCALKDKIYNDFSNRNKILAFLDDSDYNYSLKSLEFDGYKIDFKTLENISDIEFNDYNIIITKNNSQTSTLISNPNQRKLIDGIKCSYIANSQLTRLKNKDKENPYTVTCKISNKFLNNKHLNLVEQIKTANKNNHQISYYIYRNKEKPLIIK